MRAEATIVHPLPSAWGAGCPPSLTGEAVARVVRALARWFEPRVAGNVVSDAAALRQLASRYENSDPGFAADLRATADRAF